MKHLDDKRRLFFDMQEHSENYSDEQLEAMMAEIDKEPDTEEAWLLLSEKGKGKREKCKEDNRATNSSFFILHSSLRRVAAVFLAASFLGVLSLAGYRAIVGSHRTARSHVETDTSMVETQRFVYEVQDGDTIFRFENIRLDSILSVVSKHYGRQVVFRDKAPGRLRFYMTCHTTQSLAEFVELMNVFDGFKLSQELDTLYVYSDETMEGMR